jgi:hypothetical protein
MRKFDRNGFYRYWCDRKIDAANEAVLMVRLVNGPKDRKAKQPADSRLLVW